VDKHKTNHKNKRRKKKKNRDTINKNNNEHRNNNNNNNNSNNAISSSSSSSFLLPSSSSLSITNNKITKFIRQGTGTLFSLSGFLGSSFVSFVTDRRTFSDRFVEPINSLQNFLKSSGVDLELSQALNYRLGLNLCLLGRVHMYQHAATIAINTDDCLDDDDYVDDTTNVRLSDRVSNPIFLEEARRYMRYATAVYGQAMINAAEIDSRGRLDGKVGRVTRETIGRHINVPPEDIVTMDVSNYEGDSNHLRHMVVVDHVHKKVVLSIRGTFSLEEIVIDVAAMSREFCGGEGHSGMVDMAERVWKVAGPTITNTIRENPGYEVIFTGHSLGGGAAALVTIMVQSKQLLPKEQQLRCFTYAAPPVYTPLEFVPKSVLATTNFIYDNYFRVCVRLNRIPRLS